MVLGQAFGPSSRGDSVGSGSVTDAPGSSPDGSLDGVPPPYARPDPDTMGIPSRSGHPFVGGAPTHHFLEDVALPLGEDAVQPERR